MRALIDGDILRYRIGFACETNWYDIYVKGEEEQGRVASFATAAERDFWIEQFIGSKDDAVVKNRVVPEPIENCLHSVKLTINSILRAVDADNYTIYLTGKNNYRDELVDYYKANRDRDKKPVHYQAITDYLIEHHDAVVIEGMEADDAMGIAQYEDYHECYIGKHGDIHGSPELQEWCETIICTIDKDLDMIPGWHYNFVKEEKYWTDEVDGLRNFYGQMLTGDSSDNIPGLYKITGKRVRSFAPIIEPLSMMEAEEEMWKYVYSVYADKVPEAALDASFPSPNLKDKLTEIGKLLWIKRTPEDNWESPV